jgi:hypothetical protein
MSTATSTTQSEVTFEYPIEHPDHAFCDDMSHFCHTNGHNVAELNEAVEEGLITEEEKNLIHTGRTF